MSCRPMKISRESALLVALCAVFNLHAETLGDLIDREKSSRQLETKDKPIQLPKKMTNTKSNSRFDRVPLLWSLYGMDQQLQAILIYENKAYVVRYGESNSTKIGPWSVIKMSYSGLQLSGPKGRNLELIELPSLVQGTSAHRYLDHFSRRPSYLSSVGQSDRGAPVLNNPQSSSATPQPVDKNTENEPNSALE